MSIPKDNACAAVNISCRKCNEVNRILVTNSPHMTLGSASRDNNLLHRALRCRRQWCSKCRARGRCNELKRPTPKALSLHGRVRSAGHPASPISSIDRGLRPRINGGSPGAGDTANSASRWQCAADEGQPVPAQPFAIIAAALPAQPLRVATSRLRRKFFAKMARAYSSMHTTATEREAGISTACACSTAGASKPA